MATLLDTLGPALQDDTEEPDAVTVTAKRPQGTPPTAYDNTADLQAARGAQNQYDDPSIPHPRSIYKGRGTLGNVLGILGDAFLIHAGEQPKYRQQLEREQMGDNMAGFQNNPGVAASRIAASGLPGATELATKLFDTSETMKLRKAQQDSLNQYREGQTQNREDTLKDRAIQQATPVIAGYLQAGAQAEAAGKTGAYNRAVAAAKAAAGGRNLDFNDFGLPDKFEDYQAGFGQTARQITQGNISQSSVDERKTAAGVRDATTRRGQDMQFGKPTAATELTRIRNILNNGGTLNQGDQQTWNEYTTGKQKTRVKLPGLDVGDTTAPKPTASDLAYVKSHPESRAAFQKHFGIAP